MEDEDLTAEGFLRRAASKRAVAEAMVDKKAHCVEAFVASGFALEFTLKAIIMRKRRLNAWPSASSGLHTHDLRSLLQEVGVDLKTLPPALRPKMRQVLDWTRGHDYYSKKMPRSVAASMVAATFGDDGVIQWLLSMEK